MCPEMVVLAGGGLAYGAVRGDGGGVSGVRVCDGGHRQRSVARPRVSADGPASGNEREVVRRSGVRVVAEPADGCSVSVADGGGVGAGGVRVSAGVRPVGERDAAGWHVPGGVVRHERRGTVGHGRELVGVDIGLLGRQLQPSCGSRRAPGSTLASSSGLARASGSPPPTGSTTGDFALRRTLELSLDGAPVFARGS